MISVKNETSFDRRAIIGAPWNNGQLPPQVPKIHLHARFESTGLGVTTCGIRQGHRSNGWAWYDPDNHYQRELIREAQWTHCWECFS